MRAFSPTAITVAGLLLALVEFATGATELPGLLGEDTYAIIALVLGAIGVACTFILRNQVAGQIRDDITAIEEQLERTDPNAADHSGEAGDEQ